MAWTRLTKPVRRRIGGLIVELTETHVSVRRARQKRGVRIALAELVAAADQVRPPRGWVPQIGETVAVGVNRHRATVRAVIPCLPEIAVRVCFARGRERTVYLSQLAPVESETLLIRCERIPTDGTTNSGAALF